MGALLDFTNKIVVVTGSASGMGAAARRLFFDAGATVHTLDVQAADNDADAATDDRPADAHHVCDLGDRASIDRALAHLPDRVDALVNCAGIPNGGRFSGADVMRVNWLGLRHLTEAILPRIPEGGSVVHVASTAGRDWADNRPLMDELMDAATFEEGEAWLQANADRYGDGYVVSKQAVQYYTMWRAVQLLPTGVRMNSVCPGITDTAIIADFRRGMGTQTIDHAVAIAGRFARPEEMAPAMLFLADDASSSYLNGVNLNIDRGTNAARLTDQTDPERLWSNPTAG